MSFYKEIFPFMDYIQSIRKIDTYFSFDLLFPSKWSLPKTLVDENKAVGFETNDPNYRGVSFVTEIQEKELSSTLLRISKIIKLNKERELKELLFKQTIEKLKKTFEQTDLDSLQKLYFDFEKDETELNIDDEQKLPISEMDESDGE